MTFADFEQIWFTDFEFSAPPGDRPQPICMVALEFKSGNVVRLWMDELRKLPQAPYRTGSGVLIVAFYASAEISCHLALGWPLPSRLLDLYVEFRNHFLKGPVPLAWLVQAGRQSGLALHVGIWLWYRCGLTRSSKILFNAAELARVLGTSHRSVSRGLTALKQLD